MHAHVTCACLIFELSGPWLTSCTDSHCLQAIEEISENASREWSIEKALDKMHADWAELTFELAEWKATGTATL